MVEGNLYTVFLALSRSARSAESTAELGFLAVNETYRLAPYRQAGLWFSDSGVVALSGILNLEANAPYVHWLNSLSTVLASKGDSTISITASEVPEEIARSWIEWFPSYALWIPIKQGTHSDVLLKGGLILVRETPWLSEEITFINEWLDVWQHAWFSKYSPNLKSWSRIRNLGKAYFKNNDGLPWWKQKRVIWAAVVVLVCCFPVRLTVLAPGELVPANPAVIRSPMDGVISSFSVFPNQKVEAGSALFDFDLAPIEARLDVANQSFGTANAEYRQFAQSALTDQKSKTQLAIAIGKIEERRAEAEYLQGLYERAHVLAPQAGTVLFDDPSEWIGRPVITGERIMRIASDDDVEIEAWLSVSDAIPLEAGDQVSLYLNSSPLFSVNAKIRYVAHEAMLRPNGQYGYRVRAALDGKTDHRIGLKGTAKLHGPWTITAYWITRRPLATIRQWLGW